MTDKKPQYNNSAFFKGEFSFVNKDAKSIDSKEHNAIVSKHVMNKYGQWKRQLSDSLQFQTRSANVLTSPMSTESTCQPIELFGAQPTNTEDSLGNTPPFSSAEAEMVAQYDQCVTNQSVALETVRPKLSISASKITPRSANSASLAYSSIPIDHFSTMSTSNTVFDVGGNECCASPHSIGGSHMNRGVFLLSYDSPLSQQWSTETANVQKSHEMIRDWNSESVEALTQDQRKANRNTYFSCPAENSTEPNGGRKSIQHPSYRVDTPAAVIKPKPLQQVQTKGQQEQPPTLLEAHLQQFWTEMDTDNLAAARRQLKELRNLVSAQGGVIFLESSFRVNLLSSDCYFALKYGTRPVFPAQEWTPGPLSQHWKARLNSAGIGTRGGSDHRVTGITSMLNSTIPHPKLRSILADLRELLEAHEYVLSYGPPADDQLLWWAKMRTFDCISRLGDHCVDLAIYPHLHERPKTQSLVVIAASLLANMVLGSPEPMRLGVKLMRELRVNFMETQLELELDDDSEMAQHKRLRLQFWVLYVGTLAEKVHPTDDTHKLWFDSRLKKLASTLGVHDWVGMRKLIQPFLFSESLHQELIVNDDVHRA